MIKKTALTLVALLSLTAFGFAQKTPLVLTVDMGQLYNDYWKAQEAQAKFNASVENAQQEIQAMIEEGMSMATDLQGMQEKISNPALTDASKQEIATEAQSKANLIRQKEAEVNNFRQQTDRTLQQRRQSIINLHLSEIREVVVEVAKEKGADLVLNTNGLAVVYFDESFDVTKDVLTKLNANKPQE
ncbi:OmpH family outer membrane protein [Rubellicoccus peritrichatus]|uniref:OmpH family outer membrane protein n=1 Tax=Rubellicoccus peritrichatus TaxID=3080537 RepID=A0AAQ3L9L1_9BACT|nr:OmpH family outer membrane protein [Puniceicoccus sp. CR14]WOO41187.1 OmpH family outer membrane protein [Puniceicoccus sp. CR14]